MKNEQAQDAIGKPVETTFVTHHGNPKKDKYQYKGKLLKVLMVKGRLLGRIQYSCSHTESGFTSMWVPITFLEVIK